MSRYLSAFGQTATELRAQFMKAWNDNLILMAAAREKTGAVLSLPLSSTKDLASIINKSIDQIEGQVSSLRRAAIDSADDSTGTWSGWLGQMSALGNKLAILRSFSGSLVEGGDVSGYLAQAQDILVIDDETAVVLYKHALQDWQNNLDQNGKTYRRFQKDIEFATTLEASANTATTPEQKQRMLATASQIRSIATAALVDARTINGRLIAQKSDLDTLFNQLKTQGLMGGGLGLVWLIVLGVVVAGILAWHLIDRKWPDTTEQKKEGLKSQSDKIDSLREQYLNEIDPKRKAFLKDQLDQEIRVRETLIKQSGESDWLGTAAWWALGVGAVILFFKIKPWEMVTDIMAALPAGGGSSSRRGAADDDDEAPVRRRPALAPAARARKPKLRPKPRRPRLAPITAGIGYRFRRNR